MLGRKSFLYFGKNKSVSKRPAVSVFRRNDILYEKNNTESSGVCKLPRNTDKTVQMATILLSSEDNTNLSA